jgi:hypothetical protein
MSAVLTYEAGAFLLRPDSIVLLWSGVRRPAVAKDGNIACPEAQQDEYDDLDAICHAEVLDRKRRGSGRFHILGSHRSSLQAGDRWTDAVTVI